MSCRHTPGSSAMTGLAATTTGAPDREVQRVFHSLHRQAADANAAAAAAGRAAPHPDPTRDQLRAWAEQQMFRVRHDTALPEWRRAGLLDRLRAAADADPPDGATFHCWQQVQAEAVRRLARCPQCGQFSARRGHVCPGPAGGPAGSTAASNGGEGSRPGREERLEQLHAELDAGVNELLTGDGWQAWLDSAAKFHRYSLNNQMLIRMQQPQATLVASYRSWQRDHTRQVRAGEHAIWVLAPRTVRRRDTDELGDPVERTVVVGFTAVPVFDVSQTDGEDLPGTPALLVGEAPDGMQAALEQRLNERGYTVAYQPVPGSANGYTDPAARRVVVDERLSPAQRCKTLAHEVAHVYLGHTVEDYRHSRPDMEVAAESVSYVLARRYGLDTAGDYSFGYIAHWSGGDVQRARRNADTVLATVRAILDGAREGSAP